MEKHFGEGFLCGVVKPAWRFYIVEQSIESMAVVIQNPAQSPKTYNPPLFYGGTVRLIFRSHTAPCAEGAKKRKIRVMLQLFR